MVDRHEKESLYVLASLHMGRCTRIGHPKRVLKKGHKAMSGVKELRILLLVEKPSLVSFVDALPLLPAKKI
jgi:hypothetical protein